PLGVGGDRPPRLRLPPVVDDRLAEGRRRPLVGVRVEALTGEEEGPEVREVVVRNQGGARVLLLDRPEGGRRREKAHGAILRDDPPERPGVRGADWLALVEHRR